MALRVVAMDEVDITIVVASRVQKELEVALFLVDVATVELQLPVVVEPPVLREIAVTEDLPFRKYFQFRLDWHLPW